MDESPNTHSANERWIDNYALQSYYCKNLAYDWFVTKYAGTNQSNNSAQKVAEGDANSGMVDQLINLGIILITKPSFTYTFRTTDDLDGFDNRLRTNLDKTYDDVFPQLIEGHSVEKLAQMMRTLRDIHEKELANQRAFEKGNDIKGLTLAKSIVSYTYTGYLKDVRTIADKLEAIIIKNKLTEWLADSQFLSRIDSAIAKLTDMFSPNSYQLVLATLQSIRDENSGQMNRTEMDNLIDGLDVILIKNRLMNSFKALKIHVGKGSNNNGKDAEVANKIKIRFNTSETMDQHRIDYYNKTMPVLIEKNSPKNVLKALTEIRDEEMKRLGDKSVESQDIVQINAMIDWIETYIVQQGDTPS